MYENIHNILGDSEKVDLILYLMLKRDDLYERTLPDISHFQLNFPTFWQNEMLDLLDEQISSKLKKIHEKEMQIFESLKNLWPNHYPNITEEIFLEALYNVKSRSGKALSLIISKNLLYFLNLATIYENDFGRKTSCLLPVYDLFNHGKERNTFFTTKVNPTTKTYIYELKASKNISAGDEIFNQYGDLSDNQLFEQYGFAFEAENIAKNNAKLMQLTPEDIEETCEKFNNCSETCFS